MNRNDIINVYIMATFEKTIMTSHTLELF